MTAEIAGQYQSQQDSFKNLEAVLATSVLLVFLVMLFQFRSYPAPLDDPDFDAAGSVWSGSGPVPDEDGAQRVVLHGNRDACGNRR